jgi:C4-dicarboxylate-binding protein DctP
VKKSLDEAVAYGNKLARKLNQEQKQKVVDSGDSKILQLTPEQRAEWVDTMKPVWDQFSDEIGSDLISAAEACKG